jgi:hypothetical protein
MGNSDLLLIFIGPLASHSTTQAEAAALVTEV